MKRNVEIRWGDHSDINKIPEPSRDLKRNPTHAFTWNVLMVAPINERVRKNLEASFITLSRPSLNEQIDLMFFYVNIFISTEDRTAEKLLLF